MKTLFICHNHPNLHPGGTEVFSHALFRELGRRDGHDVFYLGCTGPMHRTPNPGTPFLSVNDRPNELLLWSADFDRFMLSQLDLHGVMPEFKRLLQELMPDVVHFHHFLLIGVEALKAVRDIVPDARVVVTLHDYYPICHHDGEMIRTDSSELCEGSSPQACAGCFPDRGSHEFLARELHIKQFLWLADLFVAPSEFLKRRYVEWGIDPERIKVIGNGSTRPANESPVRIWRPDRERTVFGYFGNVSRSKGIVVLMDAVEELLRRAARPFELRVHGKPVFQSEEFVESFRRRLAENREVVRHLGAYHRDELPTLLAQVDCVVVPSIWWENDPLAIQEALWAERPVICADIGGMAEAVRPGVDGLHFRARDAQSLANTMVEFMDRDGSASTFSPTKPPSIESVADRYLAAYRCSPAPSGNSAALVSFGA